MKTLEMKMRNQANMSIVPYIMAGDGGLEQLEERLLFLERAGATVIEVGIPFSDPVADGPIIQEAGLRALQKKVNLEQIIAVLKNSQVKVPLVIMSYFQPIFHYGVETFFSQLHNSPVKGLIIPDLPFEHQDYLTPFLKNSDIALVQLISLTSSPARIQELTANAEGFIYTVTVNGTTGEKIAFDQRINQQLKLVKSQTNLPVLAGFGVSTLEHVENFSKFCDGVIIGSKVVKMFAEKQEEELAKFLQIAKEVPKH